MGLLDDLLQPGSVFAVGESADGARSEVQHLAQKVRQLEQRLERSNLALQALWELLRERGQLTDDDLLRRMQEVDQRDGLADGRMTPMQVEYPACGRHSTSKRDQCLYCGKPLPGRTILERL